MTQLEAVERQFFETLARVESELARIASARGEIARSLELIDRLESRAETAIRQLRDLIRQGEGS